MVATARVLVHLFLSIPLLFFIHLSVSRGQGESECGCDINSPFQTSFNTLPQVPSGVQVILPDYRFRCDGPISHISVQVMGESTRLDMQIWRPKFNEVTGNISIGVYSLHWSSSLLNDGCAASSDSVLPERFNNIVVYAPPPNGVLVKEGDVMGYYIEQNSNPIRMVYFNTTTMESGTSPAVYALEDVDGPLCNISLTRESNVKSIFHAAPIIFAGFECPIMPPSTKATEGLTTPKSQTNEPTISTPELIADESTASEPINEETTIPTEPLSLPASVIAAVVLAMLVVITLIIFATVLLASAVVVSKKRRSGSSVNLNLGVTNQFPASAVGGDSYTIEAKQNEAYGILVTGGDHEMAAHTEENMYSYPIVPDPYQTIEAKRNDAYAVSIITKKNEAYTPISKATRGTADEYDYIT